MKKIKKIIKDVGLIISVVFFILAIVLVLLSSVAKKNNKLFSVFGYSYSVVATPSMKPDINVGEIVIIKKLNYDKYLETAKEQSDVLVYFSKQHQIFIVHQLYEVSDSGLILKGTNNPSPDQELVTEDNFHGIVINHGGQWLGNFLLGSKSLMFLVFISFLIFVIISESLSLFLKKENATKPKLDAKTRKKLEEEVRQELKEEPKNV